jgi:hypothetical protein
MVGNFFRIVKRKLSGIQNGNGQDMSEIGKKTRGEPRREIVG